MPKTKTSPSEPKQPHNRVVSLRLSSLDIDRLKAETQKADIAHALREAAGCVQPGDAAWPKARS